jgi:hypothetical protein
MAFTLKYIYEHMALNQPKSPPADKADDQSLSASGEKKTP